MTLFTYHMLHTPLFHILFPLLARNPAYAFVLSQANPDSTLATPLSTSFSRTHSSQPYISRIHSAFSCLGSVPPLDGRIRAHATSGASLACPPVHFLRSAADSGAEASPTLLHVSCSFRGGGEYFEERREGDPSRGQAAEYI